MLERLLTGLTPDDRRRLQLHLLREGLPSQPQRAPTPARQSYATAPENQPTATAGRDPWRAIPEMVVGTLPGAGDVMDLMASQEAGQRMSGSLRSGDYGGAAGALLESLGYGLSGVAPVIPALAPIMRPGRWASVLDDDALPLSGVHPEEWMRRMPPEPEVLTPEKWASFLAAEPPTELHPSEWMDAARRRHGGRLPESTKNKHLFSQAF